ncbi:MAG: hypothetical protein QOE70_43 [Chthoniobacter sp.]|jgi:hypothetical protein|nr:hypothetical protein [Chthoniobacter sp.]
MKGKQLLLLLLLVVIVGGGGYYLQKGNQDSWTDSGARAGGKVLDFPINDVARVLLKTSTAELNLVKKNDEWTVQERADYPANFEPISSLLRKLWDLKTVQEVKVGSSQMARLELVEPGKGDASGTLVEFKDKGGKSIGGVLLGKKHMRKSEGGPMGDMGGFPSGRYVMPLGGKKVSLVSESLEEVDPKPENWLRKDFIKIENPKAISVVGPTDAMHWNLTRETASADWKLADAKPEEQVDSSKVSQFGSLLSSPNFKDVLAPDAKAETLGLDKPTTATIETFDGFTYTLKIGKLTDEAYPVQLTVAANLAKERTPGKDEKPEDKTKLDEQFKTTQKRLEDKLAAEKKFEQRSYLLEKFTIDALLKERTALLAEKKPEPPAAPAPTTPPAPAAPAPAAPLTSPAPVAPPVPSATNPPPVPEPAPPAPPTTNPPPAPPPAAPPAATPPAGAPPAPADSDPSAKPAAPASPPSPPPASPPPPPEAPPDKL